MWRTGICSAVSPLARMTTLQIAMKRKSLRRRRFILTLVMAVAGCQPRWARVEPNASRKTLGGKRMFCGPIQAWLPPFDFELNTNLVFHFDCSSSDGYGCNPEF